MDSPFALSVTTRSGSSCRRAIPGRNAPRRRLENSRRRLSLAESLGSGTRLTLERALAAEVGADAIVEPAARSGVDVRFLPYESDSWAAQYASDSYIEESLESGIRIFRYCKGFIHAKTMLVDDKLATIGTANLDYRSFALNFEMTAMIYDEAINDQMAGIFQNDLLECEEVELARWKERGIRRKLKESFNRLWAPLL